jgi:hypothetical protein
MIKKLKNKKGKSYTMLRLKLVFNIVDVEAVGDGTPSHYDSGYKKFCCSLGLRLHSTGFYSGIFLAVIHST